MIKAAIDTAVGLTVLKGAVEELIPCLAAGRILRHGAPKELVHDEVVRSTYLGEGFTL